jgi:hypothetical protein
MQAVDLSGMVLVYRPNISNVRQHTLFLSSSSAQGPLKTNSVTFDHVESLDIERLFFRWKLFNGASKKSCGRLPSIPRTKGSSSFREVQVIDKCQINMLTLTTAVNHIRSVEARTNPCPVLLPMVCGCSQRYRCQSAGTYCRGVQACVYPLLHHRAPGTTFMVR